MLQQTEKSPIVEKTEELCQTILAQPEFEEITKKMSAFLEDETAQKLYRNVLEKQNELQKKQHEGIQLTEDEINDFEKEKETLFQNASAKEFFEAQQDIHKVQETVNQYVAKTFELGKLPQSEDFEDGTCGPNCGCH